MFVIAGPNGAGKSTFYEAVLKPSVNAPFINADIIQRDELKDPAVSAAYQAARIADARRDAALREQRSFITETTFSHPSKLELIDTAKAAGFRVATYHINVRSPELSVMRVATRVRRGGHDVPEHKIRERYERNQALIKQAVLQSDRAYVYDNSTLNRRASLAIKFRSGTVIEIGSQVSAWARKLYEPELEMFSPARLNPGAASFADGKAIATRIGGTDAALQIATSGETYRGTVVGETALHWIQRLQDSVFVAHFKDRLPADVRPRVGDAYALRYEGDRIVLTPSTERAAAFANLDAGIAKARFPELAGAVGALDDLRQRVQADGALSDKARSSVLKAGCEALLERLDDGQIVAPGRSKTVPEPEVKGKPDPDQAR
jgi:predicted ABC-type ATPase